MTLSPIAFLVLVAAAISLSASGSRAQGLEQNALGPVNEPLLFIHVQPAMVGFDLSRIGNVVVACQVGASKPAATGYPFGQALGSGYLNALSDSREAGSDRLTPALIIPIDVSASLADIFYYHCKVSFTCRVAEAASACPGVDAGRSVLFVTGTVPRGWD